MRCSVNVSQASNLEMSAMSHLIRFTKGARGIVFSLRRAIVVGTDDVN